MRHSSFKKELFGRLKKLLSKKNIYHFKKRTRLILIFSLSLTFLLDGFSNELYLAGEEKNQDFFQRIFVALKSNIGQTLKKQKVIAHLKSDDKKLLQKNWSAKSTTMNSYTCGEAIAGLNSILDCANHIGGKVYNDLNYDGQDNESGVGISGIQVIAFDSTNVEIDRAITDSEGEYSLENTSVGNHYRIEFIIPDSVSCWKKPTVSTGNNNTTIQFATPSTCINLGMANPANFCQTNPNMATPCYIAGDPLASGSAAANGEVLVSFDYNSQGQGQDYGFTGETTDLLNVDATAAAIGSTWGLAYQRSTKHLFTSAFLKRHVGIGPLGEGGIYLLDYSTGGNPTIANWLDVNTVGINTGQVGSGASPALRNANRGLSANPTIADSGDPLAFDAVGKIGLGDIDISDDEKFLWVINLNEQTLNAIEIDADNNPATSPTAADVSIYNIPDPCGTNTHRPFAVKYYQGKVYVGLVCENSLEAFIYTFDGNLFSPVAVNGSPSIPLDYTKGFATINCNTITGWFTWSATEPPFSCDGSLYSYPTPMLSDIEIDTDGSLILGFMDRMGHQIGTQNTRPGGTGLANYHAGGDLLRICNINGDFYMQGSVGGCNNNSSNNEGPNGGEYYHQDYYNETTGQGGTRGIIHSETVVGGMTLHPSRNEIAINSYDAFNTFFVSGGINWFNNTTGLARDPGYLLYVGENTGGLALSGTFGKANGLGDLELFCNPAPVEIGNYVWFDINKNGIQDANESGLSNLTIRLFDADCNLIGVTTTNNSGHYTFNASNVDISGVNNTGVANNAYTGPSSNTNYYVVLGNDGDWDITNNEVIIEGNFYGLTESNVDTKDAIDSDAILGTGCGFTEAPFILITTGNIGCMTHDADFGLQPIGELTLSATISNCIENAGNFEATANIQVDYDNAPNSGSIVIEQNGNVTGLASISGTQGQQTIQIILPANGNNCLLYTSPSPRDRTRSRMPSSA